MPLLQHDVRQLTCTCGHSSEAHTTNLWGDCGACDCRTARNRPSHWMAAFRAWRRQVDEAVDELSEPCEHGLQVCFDCQSQRTGW